MSALAVSIALVVLAHVAGVPVFFCALGALRSQGEMPKTPRHDFGVCVDPDGPSRAS